eukprot:150489-Pleurochrysis_carterae.AAC.2
MRMRRDEHRRVDGRIRESVKRAVAWGWLVDAKLEEIKAQSRKVRFEAEAATKMAGEAERRRRAGRAALRVANLAASAHDV